MFRLLTLMMGAIVAISLLVMSLIDVPVFSNTIENVPATRRPALVLLCAASNRQVMETVVENYMNQCDGRIELQFGPSQALISGLEVTGEGDLLLPADQSYLEMAEQNGLTGRSFHVASMNVVLAVRRGNPLSIHSLRDLERSDVRLVQANPELAAIGKLTKERLEQFNAWRRLERVTDGFVSTVTEAANSVSAGAGDAAIVYDVVVMGNQDLEIVTFEELSDLRAEVNVAITSGCKDRRRARHFINFLTNDALGRQIYQSYGFTVPPHDEPE